MLTFVDGSGALCCVSSETAFFVLKCDKDAIALYLEQGLNEEDGCEGAFEPMYEVRLQLLHRVCFRSRNMLLDRFPSASALAGGWATVLCT